VWSHIAWPDSSSKNSTHIGKITGKLLGCRFLLTAHRGTPRGDFWQQAFVDLGKYFTLKIN